MNGLRPTRRTLPEVPSVAQIEHAMMVLRYTARGVGALYRQAEEIAYDVEAGGNTKVSGGSIDPTQDAVLAGFVNEESDDHDALSRDRQTLRSAVDYMASSMLQLGHADSALRSIIRMHERSGKAADPEHGSTPSQTYTGRKAEQLASDADHKPLAEGLTDRRFWPKRRRSG